MVHEEDCEKFCGFLRKAELQQATKFSFFPEFLDKYFGQNWIHWQKIQLDKFSTIFCNPVKLLIADTKRNMWPWFFVHTVISRFSQPILTVATTEKRGEGVATTKHKNHLLSFWRLWKILSLHSLRIIQLIYFLRKWILSLGKVDPWLGSWKYEASKVPNGPHTSFMFFGIWQNRL